MLYDSIDTRFSKWQKCTKQSSNFVRNWGKKVAIMGNTRFLCGDWTVLFLLWWYFHESINVVKLHRTIHNSGMKVALSCPTLCDPMAYTSLRNSPGQTGVGSLSLLQGIFPTQGLNPGLLNYRWILYQLSHKGSHKGIHNRVLWNFQSTLREINPE